MEQTGKFSNGRAALGLLALVILAAAQLGAQLLASLPLMVGAPVWLGNVLAGVLYAALGVAGLLLLCGKGLRVTPEECRLAPVRLRPVWAASAVLMPALAAGALLCQPGLWQAGSAEDAAAVAAGAVFFFGAGTGIVEEAVFRGVLILAAGTAVGVLFSLVAYESGTVWCGAAMHAVWNMVMIGGVLHIGPEPDGYALLNYVLDSASPLVTGGDFGVEASLPSIAVYLGFSALALVRLKRSKAFAHTA